MVSFLDKVAQLTTFTNYTENSVPNNGKSKPVNPYNPDNSTVGVVGDSMEIDCSAQPDEPEVPEEKQPTARQVKGVGISGSYTITDTGNGGYKLMQQFSVIPYKNQAIQVYTEELNGPYGFKYMNENEDGYYSYRGIKARSSQALRLSVRNHANKIAIHTAVYQDLQTRQSNGEILTASEKRFMDDYNSLLQKSGLKMNANGELENIQTPKAKGRRK